MDKPIDTNRKLYNVIKPDIILHKISYLFMQLYFIYL